MKENVRRDMNTSMEKFSIIEPILKSVLKLDKIISIEKETEKGESDAAKWLDMYCGIDAYAKRENRGVYGIASRMQNWKGYKTFTVRKSRPSGAETEYGKLLPSNKNGGYLSHYFVQAYFDENGLKSWAVCKTADLIKYIDPETTQTKTAYSGEEFYVVNFDEMVSKGFDIIVDGVKYPKAA